MKSFRLLTLSVFAAATVPRLAHRGMFVDGITYASIARNLAEGRGRFWAPFYTATLYPEFHEHPPLGFWLQSLWFRLFGDHLFVERAYAIAAAGATAGVIELMWRRLNRESRARSYGWVPILLWIIVPVVSWSIVGNLLETTVSLFTTAAIAAVVYALTGTSTSASVGWGSLSGLCIVGAVLTKGPVGLFPLVAPVILLPSIAARGRRSVCVTAQWALVVLCLAALLLASTARSSLTQYVNEQVLAAMGGRREVSASSLTILKELLQGVALPIAMACGLIAAAGRHFVPPSGERRSGAASMLLLGLAGTLPILASAKQAGHYLVPAVPVYAIAAAEIMAPTTAFVVESVVARKGTIVLNMAVAIILVATIGASYVPAIGRDRQRLADLDRLEAIIPRGAIVGICPESNGDWGLHAWLERRFLVSLDAAGGQQRSWFLKTGRDAACQPSQCAPVGESNRSLVLLKCTSR